MTAGARGTVYAAGSSRQKTAPNTTKPLSETVRLRQNREIFA
ncbi:MAG: hypothetical protein DKINENOH_02982 [bacterium]|nr:hypothetical protein [bacterium]